MTASYTFCPHLCTCSLFISFPLNISASLCFLDDFFHLKNLSWPTSVNFLWVYCFQRPVSVRTHSCHDNARETLREARWETQKDPGLALLLNFFFFLIKKPQRVFFFCLLPVNEKDIKNKQTKQNQKKKRLCQHLFISILCQWKEEHFGGGNEVRRICGICWAKVCPVFIWGRLWPCQSGKGCF